jgi:hypothetical protein
VGDLRVVPIAPPLVAEIWSEAEPFIAAACEHNLSRMAAEDVRDFLESGAMRLVAVFDGPRMIASFTVETVDYPRARALRVVHLGGERFAEWMEAATNLLEAGARNIGATVLEMYGRPGWERIFRGLGTKIAVVIEREVQP